MVITISLVDIRMRADIGAITAQVQRFLKSSNQFDLINTPRRQEDRSQGLFDALAVLFRLSGYSFNEQEEKMSLTLFLQRSVTCLVSSDYPSSDEEILTFCKIHKVAILVYTFKDQKLERFSSCAIGYCERAFHLHYESNRFLPLSIRPEKSFSTAIKSLTNDVKDHTIKSCNELSESDTLSKMQQSEESLQRDLLKVLTEKEQEIKSLQRETLITVCQTTELRAGVKESQKRIKELKKSNWECPIL